MISHLSQDEIMKVVQGIKISTGRTSRRLLELYMITCG